MCPTDGITPGLDYSPPVVTPNVTGTRGTNGWYRSDVNVIRGDAGKDRCTSGEIRMSSCAVLY